MKAVLLYAYGGPEQLRYEETEMPKYGDGEVLVRVRATSVNPLTGKYEVVRQKRACLSSSPQS